MVGDNRRGAVNSWDRWGAGVGVFVLGSTLVSETVEVGRSLVVQCLTPYEIVVCERPPLEFTLGENPHSTERDSRFFPPARTGASIVTTSGSSSATGPTRFYLPPL